MARNQRRAEEDVSGRPDQRLTRGAAQSLRFVAALLRLLCLSFRRPGRRRRCTAPGAVHVGGQHEAEGEAEQGFEEATFVLFHLGIRDGLERVLDLRAGASIAAVRVPRRSEGQPRPGAAASTDAPALAVVSRLEAGWVRSRAAAGPLPAALCRHGADHVTPATPDRRRSPGRWRRSSAQPISIRLDPKRVEWVKPLRPVARAEIEPLEPGDRLRSAPPSTKRRSGAMVGAAGIEPATPTMST